MGFLICLLLLIIGFHLFTNYIGENTFFAWLFVAAIIGVILSLFGLVPSPEIQWGG